MANQKLLYLSREDVIDVGLSMSRIIDLLEVAFREKGGNRVEAPPKPGVHPGGGDNFIHAMPAYIPAMKSVGVKWVSGFPGNQEKGLPYIAGLLILNDPETGLPVCVMDCEWITAMRTAAASVVSAKYLARADSSILGILGCGVQGRTHVEAMKVVFPLRKIMAFDTRAESAKAFAQEVEKTHGIETEVVTDPGQAVSGCDLIVTAGPILKKPHATIRADWMDEGAFASLVDFDSYWAPEAMAQASKFCTDDLDQLRSYQEVGYFQEIPPVHADLGELATERKPGRENETERTMAANLGLALDDMAVAPAIYQDAVERNKGVWLPL